LDSVLVAHLPSVDSDFPGINSIGQYPETVSVATMNSDSRIDHLETVIMHLQKQVHELDSVVLSQQRQIDLVQRELMRLAINSQTLQDSIYERRSLEEERPPHY